VAHKGKTGKKKTAKGEETQEKSAATFVAALEFKRQLVVAWRLK
jgi:hypothetical protein